ncbi:MarR family winged helix-turn-helix transcriptional regulator [Leifsonia poae]|uniref:MarR family winged helix-turn-helix transcriptional regulator n=1 Tax=Leifsonia poae TaxID=110933 RepID=UPI001CC18960|nr:MarR family transcriptional regulator [Leifsonia poae]
MSGTASDPTPSDDVRAVSADVRAAVAGIYRRFRSERAQGELGDAAIGVLAQLRKNGPQSLKALSDRAHVTPGSMSQTVNRLTADGYAIRVPDPTDGRRVLFEPTPKGAEIEAAVQARSISWLDSEIERLAVPELAVLRQATALLKKISES